MRRRHGIAQKPDSWFTKSVTTEEVENMSVASMTDEQERQLDGRSPLSHESAYEKLIDLGWSYAGDGDWVPPNGPEVPDDPRAQHLHHVHAIAREDADGLVKGDPKYGYSWKTRGGVGAYMMATRKADRLDVSMAPDPKQPHRANLGVWRDKDIPVWDIFAALEKDDRAEGVIDDIRDLRRYLLLIEAEARARGILHGGHRDNVQHP